MSEPIRDLELYLNPDGACPNCGKPEDECRCLEVKPSRTWTVMLTVVEQYIVEAETAAKAAAKITENWGDIPADESEIIDFDVLEEDGDA